MHAASASARHCSKCPTEQLEVAIFHQKLKKKRIFRQLCGHKVKVKVKVKVRCQGHRSMQCLILVAGRAKPQGVPLMQIF